MLTTGRCCLDGTIGGRHREVLRSPGDDAKWKTKKTPALIISSHIMRSLELRVTTHHL